ncbi:hypothetical protein F4804DRAFT_352618 [Jackrogersella minutella]|nr:hypothetical protein F4804DRAFT_352618 [Jackrogersella minutella]
MTAPSGRWEVLIDTRCVLGDEILIEKISAEFSWEHFYQVWHWLRKYIDMESSHKMAQYYSRQLWIQLILETIRYKRTRIQAPREAAEAQQDRIAYYSRLPSHECFKKVTRDMFVERSPGLKGTKRVKRATRPLNSVLLEAPPDVDEEVDEDTGSGNGNGMGHEDESPGNSDNGGDGCDDASKIPGDDL